MQKPFFHFSVDDVLDALLQVSETEQELFSHPFFAFLKELHDTHGITVDLYCFYQESKDRNKKTLADVSDNYQSIFKANPWIRFGPHALDYETAPYAQTPEEQIGVFDAIYKEIDRFAGAEARSLWVRLHYFSESFELADYFHENGVTALFTTDKDAMSHRMPEEVKVSLRATGMAEYKGMQFIRTHFRAENFANENADEKVIKKDLSEVLKKHGFVTMLTHEYELVRPEVREVIRTVTPIVKKKGVMKNI
ncbi:MAG: hypothetical protein COU90_01955 [Candidatus Ryanbacteria bacterium CG10_big_fil_rev_8_21_14_0_10_43_42]|uniref:NodB homology domain-containing protein n=1 Tax=Candidatus Ryanbacteria bacterium CG10_big_fil_rev_8_21_14_0_10_43_42 TaxID=1974864 RepID=A0A2M8KXG1_9BACT|nr:MAG: hypothetical protein COU90_01955 [Candidatus Ryanbacteria bacterium CG10_big_fil_rev_8_21_14_0_10_43_42]